MTRILTIKCRGPQTQKHSENDDSLDAFLQIDACDIKTTEKGN